MKKESRDLVARAGHLCDLADKLGIILNSTYTYGTFVAKPTCIPAKARKPITISLLSPLILCHQPRVSREGFEMIDAHTGKVIGQNFEVMLNYR